MTTNIALSGKTVTNIIAPSMTARAFGLEFEQLLIHMSQLPIPLTAEEEADTDSRTMFLKFWSKYSAQLVRKNIYLYIQCLIREADRPDLINIAEQLCLSIPHNPGTVLEIFFRQDAMPNRELRLAMGLSQAQLATRRKLKPLVNVGMEYAYITQTMTRRPSGSNASGKFLKGDVYTSRSEANAAECELDTSDWKNELGLE